VTTPAYPWSSYVSAFREIAVEDPTNVGFLDITARVDMSTATYGMLQGDGTHPTDKGHGWLVAWWRLRSGSSSPLPTQIEAAKAEGKKGHKVSLEDRICVPSLVRLRQI